MLMVTDIYCSIRVHIHLAFQKDIMAGLKVGLIWPKILAVSHVSYRNWYHTDGANIPIIDQQLTPDLLHDQIQHSPAGLLAASPVDPSTRYDPEGIIKAHLKFHSFNIYKFPLQPATYVQCLKCCISNSILFQRIKCYNHKMIKISYLFCPTSEKVMFWIEFCTVHFTVNVNVKTD